MADRYCATCGRELRSDSGYCPSCGETSRLTVGPLAREREDPPRPRSKGYETEARAGSVGIPFLLALCACLLLAAVWAVLRFGPGFLQWLLAG